VTSEPSSFFFPYIAAKVGKSGNSGDRSLFSFFETLQLMERRVELV
jgi:hypothetical protein